MQLINMICFEEFRILKNMMYPPFLPKCYFIKII